MGGQAGGQGYLLQAFVAVLGSLDDAEQWTFVQVEPSDKDEKADIIWTYAANRRRAVQVKHSQNQMTEGMVKDWAKALEEGIVGASEYELVLLGPCNKEVPALKLVGKVAVHTPRVLDKSALTSDAAQRLDRYFHTRGAAGNVPPHFRELLVSALCTQFSIWASSSTNVSRTEFDDLLTRWVLAYVPAALTRADADLEQLRHQLRQQDRVAEARFQLKYQACLEALKVFDEILAGSVGVEVGPTVSPFELGERARACHSMLVLSCESPKVVEVFRKIVIGGSGSLGPDLVVDLRAAIRAELGFGDTPGDVDRDRAWISTTGWGPMNLEPEQRAKINELRRQFPLKERK